MGLVPPPPLPLTSNRTWCRALREASSNFGFERSGDWSGREESPSWWDGKKIGRWYRVKLWNVSYVALEVKEACEFAWFHSAHSEIFYLGYMRLILSSIPVSVLFWPVFSVVLLTCLLASTRAPQWTFGKKLIMNSGLKSASMSCTLTWLKERGKLREVETQPLEWQASRLWVNNRISDLNRVCLVEC